MTGCRLALASMARVHSIFLLPSHLFAFSLLNPHPLSLLARMVLIVLLCLALSSNSHAQQPTSSYVESTVPTGKPIAGDYSGALRPQIHYSPPIDFMVSFQASRRAVATLEHEHFWAQNIRSSDKSLERPQWHVS